MRCFIIDGEFLCQSGMNGMHRYIYEILKRLDRIKEDDLDIRVVIPKGQTIQGLTFEHIKVVGLEYRKYTYRGITVPRYVRKENGIFCSMTNGYIGIRDSVATIHDLIPLHPESCYSFVSKLHMKMIYRSVRRNAMRIMTVSKQSEDELAGLLHIDKNKIELIGCGWEHFAEMKITADDEREIKEKFNLNYSYYYTLGSRYEYKNTRWVCEAAKRNKDKEFVVGGSVSGELIEEYKEINNIRFIGAVSDIENKILIRGCIAFLYLSRMEGFGIPPLEALTEGKNIVVADIPIFRELYDGYAEFVDPDDYEYDLDNIETKAGGKDLMEKYSWENAARKWLDVIQEEVRR